MLNTLVPGQLALPTLQDNQISHINSIRNRADSMMPETLEDAVEPLSSNLTSTSGSLHGQSESTPNNVNMKPNPGKLEIPNKRKATTDPVPDSWSPQEMISSKRVSPVGSNVKGLSVSPTLTKKSFLNSPRSGASGKRAVHVDSLLNKTQSTVSKKNAQLEVSPKGQPESYDSVRAKMRETLASALALVSQQQEGSSDGKTKTEDEVETSIQDSLKEHKPSVSNSNTGSETELVKAEDFGTSDGSSAGKKASPGIHSNEISREDTHAWNFIGTEFQSNSILSGEDSLFSDSMFFKDELLQGNGLSWVSDPTPHISELNEVENTTMSEVMDDDATIDEKEKKIQSPEALALEIESELFKLFGGVNKKYKEKGRSLLFNLKDRNNPELRERVMSGEIPPDRLCSMTAEELASKELSQWRIAKAEELDQMKVLPDSDVKVRRLVKKTHKGEYQVDFEPDIGASEELSPNLSVPSQKRSKVDTLDAGQPKSETTKVEQYDNCEITIPSDGTDMQGLMVDDMKDLPPIVSLDEFMESLNKEPPFENIPVDSVATAIETIKENPEVALKSKLHVEPSKPSMKTDSQNTGEVCLENKTTIADKRPAVSPKGLDTSTVRYPKQEQVWEGLLQLNLSSMAKFVALYKSGEKANTGEWADFFDIKGRVRLDAFDKFLQALPMSRTRAIMVSHFVLKEGSTDSECSSLVELVDSYISDERLGFAEPAPGVELYLCPPRTKTVDMIINHLPKSYTEKLNSIDDGLIGIVVWRKVQITPSVISPNSSSDQKHTTKNYFGGQNSVNDMNRTNTSLTPRSGPSPPILSKPPQPVEEEEEDDDDDDVPPGFGPPAHRDDDDLPEFKFSGGSNMPKPIPNPNPIPSQGMTSHHHNLLRPPAPAPAPAPAREVDQMRELIQKYGQNGTNVGGGGGIPTQPWNDDDDDDIPEWQPQAPPHLRPPPPPPQPPQPIRNPTFVQHMAHHALVQRPPRPPVAHPIQPLQPPMNVQQQGTWWPYGVNNNVGSLPSGQFNVAPGPGPLPRDWRPNNNKGF